jgi:hypothetical protein
VKAGQQPTASGPGALQQQGAQAGAVAQQAQTQGAVQQAGQQAVAAQKEAQMGQIAQQEQNQMSEIQAQKALSDQQRSLETYAREIGSDMMAERRDFSQKKANTAFNNERQLADWVVTNTENQQEFQSRMQEMQQASQKKIQTLEILNKRMMIEEEQLAKGKMNAETRAMKKKLAAAQAALQKKIARERKKAAKKGGMFKKLTGAGMVVVGGVMSAYGMGAVGVPLMAQGAGQYAAGDAEASQ